MSPGTGTIRNMTEERKSRDEMDNIMIQIELKSIIELSTVCTSILLNVNRLSGDKLPQADIEALATGRENLAKAGGKLEEIVGLDRGETRTKLVLLIGEFKSLLEAAIHIISRVSKDLEPK